MPPPLGAGGIMFSGCPSVCPSVRPKPEIPSFDLYMGPLVHPTNRDRFTACPSVCLSVRPSGEVSGHSHFGAILTLWNGSNLGFPGISRRTHGGNGLKFCTLMYLDHLQNWLVYGHGLLNFVILALFWLCETGQIWGFRAFPGERMEGMAWNLYANVSWPPSELISLWSRSVDFIILALFWLSETGQIWGFRAFPGERMEGMAWNFACWCIMTTFRTD